MKSSSSAQAFATTSWDDGALEDLRLGELLAKYQIPACFYIPRDNPERGVIDVGQIRELASTFEIGGHTLSHRRLTSMSFAEAKREIHECKAWLEDVIGKPVRSFCYPGGLYTASHLREVKRAGFSSGRTADWMCFARPKEHYEVNPSMHLYPHSAPVHVAHCVRRKHLRGLFHYARDMKLATDPVILADKMLDHVVQRGGVFHLWGHSWEIEKMGLWRALEEILKRMSAARSSVPLYDNAQIVELA